MKLNTYSGLFILSLALLFYACANPSEQGENKSEPTDTTTDTKPEKKKVVIPRFASPANTIEQTIGVSTITINYSRPSIVSPEGIDRTGRIWGILVPFDFNSRPASSKGKPIPWRAGANENTTINFSHDVSIEGQPLKAGTYGLFMAIHEQEGATIIFSNTSDAWGSFSYDVAEDALRVEAKTETIALTDRLIYTVRSIDKTSGKVLLDWEKKRVVFNVAFDTHGIVLANFRNYLTDTTGLTWGDYNRAAKYCADNAVNLEEGLLWVEKAIAMKENYRTLITKASILEALGNQDKAQNVMDKALNLSTTNANNYYSYGTQLLRQGKTGEAIGIYQRLNDKWPDDWRSAHGMARGLSAKGMYGKALQLEKKALVAAPEANKGYIEWAIGKLEKGIDFN